MQAARGTPLSPSEPDDQTTDPRPRRWATFALIAVVGFAADLATKEWALGALADGDREVVPGILTLHLTSNPGAAFSTGTSFTVVFSCIATLAAIVVLWLSRRLRSAAWAVALGLLLAGITGNLFDRVFREPGPMRGHVIDFLMLPNWPVFNVADICICTAAGLIILQSLRGVALDGTRYAAQENDDRASDR